MWDAKKSVNLSIICTRALFLMEIVVCLLLPKGMNRYLSVSNREEWLVQTLIIMYACAFFAFVSLLCLDKLLLNIQKEEVFIEKNVSYLRVISWCACAFSIIVAFGVLHYISFIFISVIALFLGLIIRVIKNVIQQAIILKNENDFTI